ncbi:MAG: hypothetical protein WC509_06770 [Candidatus Izemoplasmatales bacterium]
MKSLRNKIILSGLVLLFALVATIGSTFAWFTVSNTVTVAAMQLNVKTSESLLIKVYENEVGDETALLDANNYKANLALTDITDPEGDGNSTHAATELYWNLSTWYMTDVTATTALDGTTLGNVKDLRTLNIDTKAWSATGTTVANSATGNFVELKFWVLSQGTGTEDVVLSDLAIDTVVANSDTQDNIVNAVRLATWVSQTEENAVDGTAFIYSEDPDYDFTFTAGMRGYDSGVPTNNSILADSRDDLVTAHALFKGSADVADVSGDTLAEADVIYTLSQNIPTLFTVRIYIEGWDSDTTNGVLAAAFNISFKFSLQDIA